MSDWLTFQRAYHVKDRERNSPTQGQWFSYGKRFYELSRFAYARHVDLIQKHIPTIRLQDHILCIGAGFGYLEMSLRDVGFLNVTSLDNSQYVVDNLLHESYEDVRNGFIQADILGDVSGLGTYDIVISELLLSAVEPIDHPTLFANCDTLAPTTCHLVVGERAYNELYDLQSLSQWQFEYPQHIYIDVVSGDKAGGV